MMVLVAKKNKSTVSFMISYCVMPFSCSKLMHKSVKLLQYQNIVCHVVLRKKKTDLHACPLVR